MMFNNKVYVFKYFKKNWIWMNAWLKEKSVSILDESSCDECYEIADFMYLNQWKSHFILTQLTNKKVVFQIINLPTFEGKN